MEQVIEQPNGKLCIYSPKDNKMLLEDATASEVVNFMVTLELKDAKENIIQRTRDLIAAAKHNKEPLHEFAYTYWDAIERIIDADINDANTRGEFIGCKLNPNKLLVRAIVTKLKKNKEKSGKLYCPCSLIKDESTICCCSEWKKSLRDNSSEFCHCKLYYNPNFRK
jgi:ferredoxin-thioredoxin reductase catalytic subunit